MLIKESGHSHGIIRLVMVEDFSTRFKCMSFLISVCTSWAALISELASCLIWFPSCCGIVNLNLPFQLNVMAEQSIKHSEVQCNKIIAQTKLFSDPFFCSFGPTCKHLTHSESLRRMHKVTKMKVKVHSHESAVLWN